MKLLWKNFRSLTIVLASILLMLTACSEDNGLVDNPGPGSNPPQTGDPDKITQDLTFVNASMKTGTMPTPNGTVADLKIDRDTLFWVEGIKGIVSLLKPEGFIIQTFSAQVEGSDSYIEASFDTENESDSIVVLSFEFDPSDWDLPLTFDLKIVPTDGSGTPLDEIDVPVVIEDPYNGNPCRNNFFITNPANFIWLYTTRNGELYEQLHVPNHIQSTANGCCLGSSGDSEFGDCIGLPTHGIVDTETGSTRILQMLEFFDDGQVRGLLQLRTQGHDQLNSNYCSNTAAYLINDVINNYSGEYDYNSATCKLTIDNLDGLTEPFYAVDGTYIGEWPLPVPAGHGSNAEYELLSNSILKESIYSPEGGGLIEERIHGRLGQTIGLNNDDNLVWYD